MLREWRERGIFEWTEQHVCKQAKEIRKNDWSSELELEAMKSQVEEESQGELWREQDLKLEVETIETNVGTVEKNE